MEDRVNKFVKEIEGLLTSIACVDNVAVLKGEKSQLAIVENLINGLNVSEEIKNSLFSKFEKAKSFGDKLVGKFVEEVKDVKTEVEAEAEAVAKAEDVVEVAETVETKDSNSIKRFTSSIKDFLGAVKGLNDPTVLENKAVLHAKAKAELAEKIDAKAEDNVMLDEVEPQENKNITLKDLSDLNEIKKENIQNQILMDEDDLSL